VEKIQKPRGTQDILPSEQKYWDFVVKTFERKIKAEGFSRIETPIFEYKEVFERPLGSQTDIVEKQMFSVGRKTDDNVEREDRYNELILRPEYTASIMRAYLETGMGSIPQPIKLYYYGPLFRYERPQKGRLRQFNQIGFEIIGDASPSCDALVIYSTYRLLKSLRLSRFIKIEINSLGCKTCRKEITQKLIEYFSSFRAKLCDDCKRRLQTNPRRILECKEIGCKKIAEGSPETIDLACETCKKHFRETLENLEILKVPYELNTKLVRGLDYYTRTAFEVKIIDDAGAGSIGGGGRYDGLSERLGGGNSSAIGVALGTERIIELIKEKEISVPEVAGPQMILIQLGPKAKARALELYDVLLKKGFRVFIASGKESLKAQLRLADKKEIRFALILGEREVFENSIIIKDLEKNSQSTVLLKKLFGKLKKII